MAFYFAEHCQSPEKRRALYELIRNEELKEECNITRMSDVIHGFMIDDSQGELSSPTMHPVNDELFKHNPHIRTSELTSHAFSDQSFIVCRTIEEKKLYMKRLFEYFITLKKPEVIYFSSEEVVDWIYNDPKFYDNFRSWCITLINKGFTFVRIMKPMENKEYFLRNTLLWLPMYMTGHVHLYYYPHFRDDIYRQTTIAVNNAASYYSSSIAKTNTCYYSFFTTDPTLSAAFVRQSKDYLACCRPSFYICKSEQSIAEAFSDMMSLPGDRITKCYHISPESIPYK
jgi:hypothetical protein